MDFYDWRESEEPSARSYRWCITSCGISSREDAEEAAKNAYGAGNLEGLKKAKEVIESVVTLIN